MLIYAFTMVIFVKQREKTGLLLHIICVTLYIYAFAMLSRATSYSEAVLAIKFEYIGSVFCALTMLYTLKDYFKIRIPSIILYLLSIVDMVILMGVLSFERNPFFYTEVRVVEVNPYYVLHKSHGILYNINAFSMIFVSGFCIVMAVDYYRKRGELLTYDFWALVVGISSPIISFMLYLIFPKYDFASVCLFIADSLFMSLVFTGRMFDMLSFGRESVMENIGYGFLITDSKEFILSANTEARRLLKLDRVNSFTNMKDIEIPGEMLLNDLYLDEGTYFSFRRTPVYDDQVLKGSLYVITDVTETIKEREKIMKLSEESNAANEAKSEFLANISHEIRTPINTIIGMNDMVLEETDQEAVKEHANDIKMASELLLGLVNDVLDFSKIEKGKLTLSKYEFSLPELLSEVITLASFKANQKGLMFSYGIDQYLPTKLLGDKGRIRQILTNLLDNAVKYTDSGEVDFTVTLLEKNENAVIYFEVKDTGRGIKEGDIDKITSAFTRVDEEKNSNIMGTGLGLSITTSFVELMGSRLHVDSVYQEGSTFSFDIELPIIDDTQIGLHEILDLDTKNDLVSTTNADLSKYRILVVDDNRMNCKVVEELLKSTKAKLSIVYSGEQAVNMACEEKYDLMLIDYMMPEMDGIETLKSIKENPKSVNADSPAIMLTANVVRGVKEQSLEAGFVDYISKPVRKTELIRGVEKWLPQEYKSEYIDRNLALEYCEDSETLVIMWNNFLEEWQEKEAKLLESRETADDKLYQVLVHGLKNNAMYIGARKLSEQAKAHEMAVKDGNKAFIDADFDSLIRLLHLVMNEVEALLPFEDDN